MNIASTAITYAKTLLSITDTSQDNLLVILGTEAEQNALASTHNEDVLFDWVLLARMIQFSFNRNNEEGITSQTLAGVGEAYQTEYPNAIKSALRGYNTIKVL